MHSIKFPFVILSVLALIFSYFLNNATNCLINNPIKNLWIKSMPSAQPFNCTLSSKKVGSMGNINE